MEQFASRYPVLWSHLGHLEKVITMETHFHYKTEELNKIISNNLKALSFLFCV